MNVYERVQAFYEGYRGEKCIYGTSVLGRNLYAFFVGRRERPTGICQAAIHGREYITALLNLAQIEHGVSRGGVWFLPLTNPDGALLSEVGLASVNAPWRRDTLKRINGSDDFRFWKANADAVDLNVNFDAGWSTGKSNVTYPASENYVGKRPFSAPESRALKDFTYQISPDYTVSYHTKGEEIYWRFHEPPLRLWRDRKLAKVLSQSTGYPLKSAKGSAGGYKDWCVEKLKIPAFTVEAGSDSLAHPLGEEALAELISHNLSAIDALSKRI